jgi:hypothetical protein
MSRPVLPLLDGNIFFSLLDKGINIRLLLPSLPIPPVGIIRVAVSVPLPVIAIFSCSNA